MQILKKVSLLIVGLCLASQAFAGEGKNGGFADDSARDILEKTSKLLVKDIKEVSSEAVIKALFNNFLGGVPKGYDTKELIRVIETVRSSEKETRFRDDRELMFDYGYDEVTGQPYIIALQKYFLAYLPWTAGNVKDELVRSLMEKLLHEASHFWGYNDQQAKVFARVFAGLFYNSNDAYACASDLNLHDEKGQPQIATFMFAFESLKTSYQGAPQEKFTFSHLWKNSEGPSLVDGYGDLKSWSNSQNLAEFFNSGSGVTVNTYPNQQIYLEPDSVRKLNDRQFTMKVSVIGTTESFVNSKSQYTPVTLTQNADLAITMDPTFLNGTATLKSSDVVGGQIKFKCHHNRMLWMTGPELQHSLDPNN